MNKRQKKKKQKKTLPLLADEYPLLTMTKAEWKSAIKQAEKFRLKYGYRKKYSNLKRQKCLKYNYPIGKEYSELLDHIHDVSRVRKGRITVVNQSLEQLVSEAIT